jgi:transglutaminase-like putative cysteine protease
MRLIWIRRRAVVAAPPVTGASSGPAPGRFFHDHLHLLPLYGAGLVVTLCGIGAAGLAFPSPALGSPAVGLTVLGFLVSLLLRIGRVNPVTPAGAALGLGFLATVYWLLATRPVTGGGAEAALGAQIGGSLAALLSGFIVLRSFTLVTNDALLFCPVPTLAILGLAGSGRPSAQVLAYFLVSLWSAMFLVGYDRSLRLQQTTCRVPDTLLRAHATISVLLFFAVTLAGILLTVMSRPALSRLSLVAGPILRQARNLPGFAQAIQNQSKSIPVGSGPIDRSDAPVMDVYASEGGLWRTAVRDHWDRSRWSQLSTEPVRDATSLHRVTVHPPARLPADEEYPRELYHFDLPRDPQRAADVKVHPVHQQILIRTPFGGASLPAASRPITLRFPEAKVRVAASGAVLAGSFINPGLTYEVVSEVCEPGPSELRGAPPVDPATFADPATLEFPARLHRVRDLARRITRAAVTPYDRAVAIQTWLEQHCPYTLREAPPPAGRDAVEWYLFTTQEGPCDLVGSAMALMCRAVGIPARAAFGYARDTADGESGAYHVTQKDAHQWVELFFPRYGWVTFNPAPTPRDTPAANVYTLAARVRHLWLALRGGGMATALSLLLIAMLGGIGAHPAGEWLRRMQQEIHIRRQMARSEDGAVVLPLLFQQACRLWARHGWPRDPAATPHEYLAGLRAGPALPAKALEATAALAEQYAAARYGNRALRTEELAEARRQMAVLLKVLRRPARDGGRKQP